MTKLTLALSVFLLVGLPCLASDIKVTDMSFVDESHGWLSVIEPSPALYRTTNGGQSWERIETPGFYRISFFDQRNGIAVKGELNVFKAVRGEFGIYRTADGGDHWQREATVKDESVQFEDAQFVSADDVFVLGNNGGEQWVAELNRGQNLTRRNDLPFTDNFDNFTLGLFSDGTGHVWIVGKHLVLHSADKGKTWENQYENTTPRMDMGTSGVAVPGGKAWFSAANWEIYRTADYGKHWVRALDSGGVNFDSVSFYNTTDGCAVGGSALIYCTRDGGVNWAHKKVFKTYLSGTLGRSKIALFPSGRGWAVVAGTLYRTEDGGQNFVEMSTSGPVPKSTAVEKPALETPVNGPESLAYDRVRGYLYIVEWLQERLLRLDVKTGMIRTILAGPEEPSTGSKEHPHSVAVDTAGNVFVGDFTGRIRFMNIATGQWSVLVDEPERNLDHFMPSAITPDKSGGLLVTAYHRILRYNGKGLQSFIGTGRGFSGDGGPASNATFQFASGLAVNDVGDIFIADRENCRIRKVDHQEMKISTIAGTGVCEASGDGGPALFAGLHWPESLVIDAKNNLYYIDGNRVRRIDQDGIITTYAGTDKAGFSGDGGPADKAELSNPSGLALDERGNLYIAEFVNNRVRRVDAITKIIKTVAGDGEPHRVDVIM